MKCQYKGCPDEATHHVEMLNEKFCEGHYNGWMLFWDTMFHVDKRKRDGWTTNEVIDEYNARL